MPIIKVWCLPKESEEKLRHLHQSIVRALTDIPELGLTSEKDMTVLFPTDMMSYGLGEEIIIEISGLFEKKERTDQVLNLVASLVGSCFNWLYPGVKIEVFVSTFNPTKGFWTSGT